jgi:hypothetical protein
MNNLRRINFNDLRTERQRYNDQIVYEALIEKNETKLITICNLNQLNKIKLELNKTMIELFDECETNNLFAKLLSINISKNSSRQGITDEELQLTICNNISSNCGINIKKLNKNELRPCNDGRIISMNEYKLMEDKSTCLKSFDGEITGKINGYIFAKVVMGEGGHQDNVFIEANEFCNWVKTFGNEDKLYVVLIDTNNDKKINKLKNKFNEENKLLIVNHYEFQEYIIENYEFQKFTIEYFQE